MSFSHHDPRYEEKFKKWKMEQDNLTEEEYEEYDKKRKQYNKEFEERLKTEEGKAELNKIAREERAAELEDRRKLLEEQKRRQEYLEDVQRRRSKDEPNFVSEARERKIDEFKKFNSLEIDPESPDFRYIIEKWSHLWFPQKE